MINLRHPTDRTPRKRFWLACFFAPLPAITALFLAPVASIVVAVVGWLLALYWVLLAHSPSSRLSDIPPARLFLVALGLTIGIAIWAAVAVTLTASLVLHVRY